MSTTFDAWLRQLAASGRRIPDGTITIDRSLPFSWSFTVTGDWTGATVASSLRLDPDAAGATLEDFAAVNDGYDAVSGKTGFTLSLTKTETGALLVDDDGDALVATAIDILFTPSGGSQMRLMGGVAMIAGRVTDAS